MCVKSKFLHTMNNVCWISLDQRHILPLSLEVIPRTFAISKKSNFNLFKISQNHPEKIDNFPKLGVYNIKNDLTSQIMFAITICDRRVEHLAADVSDQGHQKFLTESGTDWLHSSKGRLQALQTAACYTGNSCFSVNIWTILHQGKN